MTEVFISYKREDESRVALIVDGLKKAGLSVWWDRAIPGGEAWRQNILDHLDAARCVIVVWSALSVSSAGEFVREEAARARSRGVLLPVRVDAVLPPLGFGEIQTLDLINWRGRDSDLRFVDVVNAAKALVEGRPRPHPAAPRRRRFVTIATAFLATLAPTMGIVGNVAGVQTQLCRVPGLRALCAWAEIGHVPTEMETKIITARQPGDCEPLKEYQRLFPTGFYAVEVSNRLNAREYRVEEKFTRQQRRMPLYVDSGAFRDEAAALKDARARAAKDAELVCIDQRLTSKFVSASYEPPENTWVCKRGPAGYRCNFTVTAICVIDMRLMREFCK
jgi:hypothetical protein